MSRFEFKLPDLGEGTVEAEIIQWHVQPGHRVAEDDVIVDVMTDKANIEIPSPVTGTVVVTTGEPGDLVPVGSVLIVFETDANATVEPAAKPAPVAAPVQPKPRKAKGVEATSKVAPTTAQTTQPAPGAARVLASPSVRRRARERRMSISPRCRDPAQKVALRARISNRSSAAHRPCGRLGARPRQTPRQTPQPKR